MPLSSNDVKPSTTSMSEFTQQLTERNRLAGQKDSSETDNDETDEQVETWQDKWQNLPAPTKYTIIACGATLATSFFFISFWQFISLLILSLIIIFGVWFSQTNLSVEITVFLAKFFPPSSQAIWDTHSFEWTQKFRDNANVIYQEYLNFEKNYNYCPQMDDAYPNGSITNWDRKWPTVTLRAYGLDCNVSKYFPKTMALLNDSNNPYLLSHCMYSIIEPDKFIPRHRGPYRGVFRYQLALEVPPIRDPERLYLAVWPETSSHEFWYPEHVPEGEPQKQFWSVGEDFIFDDTCVHEVRNSTAFRRIILFMDVERHDISWFSRMLHRFFMKIARFLPAIQQIKKVQDKMIDDNLKVDPTCEVDTVAEPNSAQITSSACGANLADADSMQYYAQAKVPEVAPYKRARILIEKQRKRAEMLKKHAYLFRKVSKVVDEVKNESKKQDAETQRRASSEKSE